jgi:hypothetical protein
MGPLGTMGTAWPGPVPPGPVPIGPSGAFFPAQPLKKTAAVKTTTIASLAKTLSATKILRTKNPPGLKKRK